MKIEFKKHKNKPASMTITRNDGSTTWQVSKHNFIQHDLVHFATESILNLEKGFYGLIAQGIDIQDFENQNRTERPNLPKESIQLEFIINLLEAEIYGRMIFEDFNKQLAENCNSKNMPPPSPIPNDQLIEIRLKAAELIQQWQILPAGNSLILDW